jgi:hypothetical protein
LPLSRHLQPVLLGLPLIAVLLGWIAVAKTAETSLPELPQAPWVRTANGWERAHWLAPKPKFHSSPVHPARISLYLGLSAALILATAITSAKPAAQTGSVATVGALSIGREDRL